MGKVRADADQRTEHVSDDRDGVTYMDETKADRLLDKHMARWSTLLERLK
ncbi:hypothetical protein [Rhodococcoides corynebacterioides]|nr:hypothetical protein [Rhodococcus corynebacterioides]